MGRPLGKSQSEPSSPTFASRGAGTPSPKHLGCRPSSLNLPHSSHQTFIQTGSAAFSSSKHGRLPPVRDQGISPWALRLFPNRTVSSVEAETLYFVFQATPQPLAAADLHPGRYVWINMVE